MSAVRLAQELGAVIAGLDQRIFLPIHAEISGAA